MRPARFVSFVVAMVALTVGGVLPASARSEGGSGQVIADLNVMALAQFDAAGTPFPVLVLNLGMVHGAIYDAVISIGGGYTPYLGAIEAPDGASATAAAAAAAHGVLSGLLPDRAADLDAALATVLEAVPDGTAEDDGVAVGRAAAAAMLAARAEDGRGIPNPRTYGDGPGEYRPTPPDFAEFAASWLSRVKPFLADEAAYYRTAGPPALESEQYATEYNEVLSLSGTNAGNQTPEQQTAAAFWRNPVTQWLFTLRELTAEKGLGIVEAARLFAIANLGVSDAAVGCFDDKDHWMFWRPVTAIAEAANDGNDATEPDQAWVDAHEGSPPYSDHPSGFNCYVGVYAGALTEIFGADTPVTLLGLEGAEDRTFDSIEQARLEVIDARIYQGLHFRSADVQGSELGLKAAALAAEKLAPTD